MPDIWYDVDVALSEVPVNVFPLTDDTDMKTREESVTYDQAGMDLVWNFVTTTGAFTQTAVTPTTGGVHDWTNQNNGMYTLEIPASSGTINNDTEGFGWFVGYATGILPWRGPTIGFRASKINDALVDSDTLMTSDDVGLLYKGTISTVNVQDPPDYDMDTAIVTDDNWLGMVCVTKDVSTGDKKVSWLSDIDQANDRFVIAEAPTFTAVAGDEVRVFAMPHPRYALNQYDAVVPNDLSSGNVGVNVTKVRGTTLTGSGTESDPWGP